MDALEQAVYEYLDQAASRFHLLLARRKRKDAVLCYDHASMLARFVEISAKKYAEYFGDPRAEPREEGIFGYSDYVNAGIYIAAYEGCHITRFTLNGG